MLMRTFSILLLSVMLYLPLFAQQEVTAVNNDTKQTTQEYPEFLSISSLIFLEALSQEIDICDINSKTVPSKELQDHFPIILKDSIYCISGFLEVDSLFPLTRFKEVGVNFADMGKTFSTICIPLYSLCKFLTLQDVIRFDICREACVLMDKARPAIEANGIIRKPRKRNKYTGEGVIIGFVDYGFDYTHPDFYTPNGKETRIVRVWEQGNYKGKAPAPFNYGRELTTTEEILAAKRDTPEQTHGTHVAAIATGTGNKTPYYGLASEAEIVFVSTTRTDVGIADGMQYIAKYAESVNKPCVINFSLGSETGPHDGTSAFDRLCEKYSRPGLIFTGAVGNNGNKRVYLEVPAPQSAADSVTKTAIMLEPNASQVIVDMWAEQNDHFESYVVFLDKRTGAYLGQSDTIRSQRKKVKTSSLKFGPSNVIVQLAAENHPVNKKNNILTQIDYFNRNPNFQPILVIHHKGEKPLKAWVKDGQFSDLNKPLIYANGSLKSTLGEIGGTGKKMISVGAYCTKKDWNSLEGRPYTYGPAAQIGEIGDFSAQGPTADGRIKPNVTCPGYGVVAANSSFFTGSYPPKYFTVAQSKFNGQNYPYGITQGTSEATPMLTGTVALMLQVDPDLTYEEVMQAISQTSTNPGEYTPNNTWGYGILNAEDSFKYIKSNK